MSMAGEVWIKVKRLKKSLSNCFYGILRDVI